MLRKRQKGFAAEGLAISTRKARQIQLKRYQKFCELFHLVPFPCSAAQASIYATYLSEYMCASSIRSYLSCIWSIHKLHRLPVYCYDYSLHLTLRGIERSKAGPKIVRYPLAASDLLLIYAHLDMFNHCDRVFWCAIVLSFRLLLRKCHVTESVHSLRVNDVSFKKDHVCVRIRSSKTDQFEYQSTFWGKK